MDLQLETLLGEHKQHFSVTPEGKILCQLNGHAFPANHDSVAAFIRGNKFKKLLQKQRDDNTLKKLEPFIIPSKNYSDRLFCALTCQLVNKTAQAARLHMQGKRFKRAKERFMSDQQDLFEEPELERSASQVTQEGDGEADAMSIPEEFVEMASEGDGDMQGDAQGDAHHTGDAQGDTLGDALGDAHHTGDAGVEAAVVNGDHKMEEAVQQAKTAVEPAANGQANGRKKKSKAAKPSKAKRLRAQ